MRAVPPGRRRCWCLGQASTSRALLRITETNGIHLVLFVMKNRTFGPLLAAINRILISLMEDSGSPVMQNRTFGPYLATINRILISRIEDSGTQ
jgi:hypothetical protein